MKSCAMDMTMLCGAKQLSAGVFGILAARGRSGIRIHPKYENWLEGKIEQLAGAQPLGTRHNGVVLKRQMIENLVCDSEIPGSQAAAKGVYWLRDERVAVLEKWGRADLAEEIMAIAPGGRPAKRLCHRN